MINAVRDGLPPPSIFKSLDFPDFSGERLSD
jgi:hypothetical protein